MDHAFPDLKAYRKSAEGCQAAGHVMKIFFKRIFSDCTVYWIW